MLIDYYQNIPRYLDPIAFAVGSFSVRWYALSYMVGFLVVYLVLLRRIERGEFAHLIKVSNLKFKIKNEIVGNATKDILSDFFLLAFFAALIGGRLGYVIFYNFSFYASNPLAIISPYVGGEYVGIYGMSYHGALLAIIISSWFFLRAKKIPFLPWADFVSLAIPLGYFFGRIGNFLNGELYGKITTSQWGMYFSTNELRHPSQLYEAILEGLLLFILLRGCEKRKMPSGSIFSLYFIAYGTMRIVVEFFREPDSQVGLLFNILTLGQLLSILMIIMGIISISRIFVFKKE